jgi:hypothetical protein
MKWTKARIVSCCKPEDYWYADKIGDIVEVRKWTESSWGVEERSTGFQIAPHDYEVISEGSV